jgi:3-oxoacyl-[acyl-carrier protein] reductase
MVCNSKVLEGKVAIITGCNRGIGAALLASFAAQGATVIAAARRNSAEFEQRIAMLAHDFNCAIKPIFFDIADESAVKESLRSVLAEVPRIDILVNNAGISHGGLLSMTPLSRVREVFQVNYFGPLAVTQVVSRKMMRQRSGVIVNVSSVAGLDPKPGNCAYGASKAALAYFTGVLAKELAEYNIRVNAVAPGLVSTEMADAMERNAREQMVASSAMRRLGDPSEIADAVLYLCSGNASFVSGQVMRVDGGM